MKMQSWRLGGENYFRAKPLRCKDRQGGIYRREKRWENGTKRKPRLNIVAVQRALNALYEGGGGFMSGQATDQERAKGGRVGSIEGFGRVATGGEVGGVELDGAGGIIEVNDGSDHAVMEGSSDRDVGFALQFHFLTNLGPILRAEGAAVAAPDYAAGQDPPATHPLAGQEEGRGKGPVKTCVQHKLRG
jgi:hypothetical protein